MDNVMLSKEMMAAAQSLGEGPVLVVCRDGNAIRMETENGDGPYVWRGYCWRTMRN